MACGYGACYGCVVEVDGRLQRLCIAGPVLQGRVTVPILNASGCLDALTAPEVALALDAFVTKTITPLPREGNQPVRIAETDAGMLNSIGLQGPGIDGLVDQTLPALSRLGLRVWVSVGGFSVGRLRRHLRAPRRSRRRRGDRAQPLVPERRGGARDGGRRSSPAAARAPRSRSTRSSRRPRGTSPSRRRAVVAAGADGLSLVNTIRGMALDPRTLRPKLGRGTGGYSGPALQADRARVRLRVRQGGRRADRRDGRRRLRARRAGARRGGRSRCLAGHHPLRRSRLLRRAFAGSSSPKPRRAVTQIRSTRGELPMVN